MHLSLLLADWKGDFSHASQASLTGYPLPWNVAWGDAASSWLSSTIARMLADRYQDLDTPALHHEDTMAPFGESLEILAQIFTVDLLEAAQWMSIRRLFRFQTSLDRFCHTLRRK